MKGKMPRINRGLIDNGFYHVINRGNGGREIFLKDEDYRAFLELIRESKLKFEIKFYGYCLMPNHFHFLLSLSSGPKMSEWMQWLMTSHVRRYHKHYGGNGHVWQGRFKSFLIQQDEHFLMVLRYVEANPLRAGLVNSAVLWRWSSCAAHLGNVSSAILDALPILTPPNWIEWVDRSVGEAEIEVIRRSVNRQAPYGSSCWQEEVAKKFGLGSTLRSQGRPRKRGQATF